MRCQGPGNRAARYEFAMRPIICFFCLALLSIGGGCSMSDIVFAAMSDHYSGGGTTWEEKKYAHDRQVEAAANYEKYGTWPQRGGSDR